MARKTIDITITEEGSRDIGKVYHLTEMPAAQAERWALRAFQALARSGVDLGELMDSGMQGLAVAGFRAFAFLPFQEAEPLLTEMMQCVQFKPNPNALRPLVDDDIEEIRTRIQLRAEVLKLHTDFLNAGGTST